MSKSLTQPSSSSHRLVALCAWNPQQPAERIDDRTLMSRGTSNSYLVVTDDGDIVINTGTAYQGVRIRARFEQLLGRPLDVRKVVLTQSHPDHMGGWHAFAGPGVETYAQAFYPDGRLDRTLLKDFFLPRSRRIVGGLNPSKAHLQSWFQHTTEADVTTFVERSLAFELGGQRFELHATPGGETLDCLVVWVPSRQTMFTGNLLGALWGALPHLYTPRGDRQRSARFVIRDMNLVLSLEPELLVTGHGNPIRGAERIRMELTKVRDAVVHIHDRTIAGMNAGKDLPTLMAEIQLPARLEPQPGRGPVHWYVRAIWEEHAGWFRQQYTSELYPTPADAIWPELAELAGGSDVLAERAAAHIARDEIGEAVHLVQIALVADPGNQPALRAYADALTILVERNGGRGYDELAWLEGELDKTRSALAA